MDGSQKLYPLGGDHIQDWITDLLSVGIYHLIDFHVSAVIKKSNVKRLLCTLL